MSIIKNDNYVDYEPKNSYLQPDDPEKIYERSSIFNSLHWGQRKLGMALVQFLNYYWNPLEVPNPKVVYAGAAHGVNIGFVSKLFPTIQWYLYDTGNFMIEESDKIHIYKEYFTDEIAEEWGERQKQDNNIFFISDIRRGMESDEGGVSLNNEIIIWDDMEAQAKWYIKIHPVKAQLKFRLPYNTSNTSDVFKRYVPYLNGKIYKGIWAPIHSTETRLVPEGYDTVHWDIIKYESQMFYFNINIRGVVKYNNKYIDINDYELRNDWDSLSEIILWKQYLIKMYGEGADTSDRIAKLSKLMTYELNVGANNPQDYRSLNILRIQSKLLEIDSKNKKAKYIRTSSSDPEKIDLAIKDEKIYTMYNEAIGLGNNPLYITETIVLSKKLMEKIKSDDNSERQLILNILDNIYS